MLFFSPQGQTSTLTALPVTAFASSVCQHGSCLSSKQYCETQRHNQSKRFHTYRLDFSLQPIPDLLTGLHPFGNIFSWRTRENTTTLLLWCWRPTYRKHTERSWVSDFIKGKFLKKQACALPDFGFRESHSALYICTKFWCLLISWSREPCVERWHSFSLFFSSCIDSRL